MVCWHAPIDYNILWTLRAPNLDIDIRLACIRIFALMFKLGTILYQYFLLTHQSYLDGYGLKVTLATAYPAIKLRIRCIISTLNYCMIYSRYGNLFLISVMKEFKIWLNNRAMIRRKYFWPWYLQSPWLSQLIRDILHEYTHLLAYWRVIIHIIK